MTLEQTCDKIHKLLKDGGFLGLAALTDEHGVCTAATQMSVYDTTKLLALFMLEYSKLSGVPVEVLIAGVNNLIEKGKEYDKQKQHGAESEAQRD